MNRLYALCILAWALIRTLLARLFHNSYGLKAFESNYAADRLPPTTLVEREIFTKISNCIACGLCEIGSIRHKFVSPMYLSMAASRSTTDADAALQMLADYSDETLAQRERICPTGVPLVQVAQLIRTRVQAIQHMEESSLSS